MALYIMFLSDEKQKVAEGAEPPLTGENTTAHTHHTNPFYFIYAFIYIGMYIYKS